MPSSWSAISGSAEVWSGVSSEAASVSLGCVVGSLVSSVLHSLVTLSSETGFFLGEFEHCGAHRGTRGRGGSDAWRLCGSSGEGE